MNRQELLAKYLGISVGGTAAVFITMLCLDNGRLQLFFSAVPESLKSTMSFAVCMIPESICIIFYCSSGYFVLYLHLMFFEMLITHLKNVGVKVNDRYVNFGFFPIKLCPRLVNHNQTALLLPQ